MSDEGDSNGAWRSISIPDAVTVRDLAEALEMKPHVVVRDLMERGVFVSQSMAIDFATASSLCSQYGVVARKII